MRSTPYSVLSRPALRVAGPDGQYALGETYRGFYSLRWTTTLPAARVFHEFAGRVEKEHAFEVRVDSRDLRETFEHEPEKTDPGLVLMEARRAIKTPGVQHFVIDYSRGSLHWENVVGSPFHEVGILSPELGRDAFTALASSLGTPAIADGVEELSSRLDFVWS